MKLKIILGVLVSLAAISSPAQTNFTIVTRTNILQAAPNFREVNGQLYNSSFSKLWHIQTGKILDVHNRGDIEKLIAARNQWKTTEANTEIGSADYEAASQWITKINQEITDIHSAKHSHPHNCSQDYLSKTRVSSSRQLSLPEFGKENSRNTKKCRLGLLFHHFHCYSISY